MTKFWRRMYQLITRLPSKTQYPIKASEIEYKCRMQHALRVK